MRRDETVARSGCLIRLWQKHPFFPLLDWASKSYALMSVRYTHDIAQISQLSNCGWRCEWVHCVACGGLLRVLDARGWTGIGMLIGSRYPLNDEDRRVLIIGWVSLFGRYRVNDSQNRSVFIVACVHPRTFACGIWLTAGTKSFLRRGIAGKGMPLVGVCAECRAWSFPHKTNQRWSVKKHPTHANSLAPPKLSLD